jgi:hypothetical protein
MNLPPKSFAQVKSNGSATGGQIAEELQGVVHFEDFEVLPQGKIPRCARLWENSVGTLRRG